MQNFYLIEFRAYFNTKEDKLVIAIFEGGWVVQGSHVGSCVLGGCSLLLVGYGKLGCFRILLVGANKTGGVESSFQLELENYGVGSSLQLDPPINCS